MTTPQEDMRLRWLPTDRAVGHAKALLAAEPAADVAVIPMYQPGKTYGIWRRGQRVETVPGVVILSTTRADADPTGSVPHHGWARDLASDIAVAELRAREPGGGTTAYALVYRDGEVAVFEDVLHRDTPRVDAG